MILQELEFIVNPHESASDGPDYYHRIGWEHGTAHEPRQDKAIKLRIGTPEWSAYHTGFNLGLSFRREAFGDVTAYEWSEAKWYAEITGATLTESIVLTPAQLNEIEEDNPGRDELEYGLVR